MSHGLEREARAEDDELDQDTHYTALMEGLSAEVKVSRLVRVIVG